MRILALVALVGCKKEVEFGTDVSGGLMGNGLLDTIPNAMLMADGHVSFPVDQLPPTPTPAPVERVAWRTGFSPAQNSVIELPGVDPDALPSWRSPTPGEGGVRLVDLDDGTFYAVMAELDAYPDDNPDPVLIVRPQEAVPYGHTVAVVVMTDVAPRPTRFTALIDGEEPPADFAGGAQHWRDLMTRLEELGIERDSVAVAWDYPVGDGTTPLRSALSQLQPPGTWSFTRIRNADDGDDVAPGAWRVAQGTFDVQNFLIDDQMLSLDTDGTVTSTGTDDATIYVHIPESVKDAPAGSVPILVMGHGIFGDPVDHLDTDFTSSPLYLADELGFIIVATRWRGLDYHDLPGALAVANDLGKIPMITDRMVQGQVNTRTLVELIAQGTITEDPVFQGASGQSLVDPDAIYFEGLSMGSIEGAVLVANGAPIKASVFHIGGSTWSTMLERSGQWSFFEDFVIPAVPDPHDRQEFYAMSQLWFDPIDPIAYVDDLQDQPLILQTNIGDDMVSNIGSTMLARSLGLPLIQPEVVAAPGVDMVPAPLPAGSRAWVQFDPGRGEPPDVNRPAPSTGAHGATEGWPGTRAQMRDFLTPGEEGTVVHHCGDEPCSPGNRGSYDN